ncbi:hypothetical protein ACFX2H_032896 [Malus domestica]
MTNLKALHVKARERPYETCIQNAATPNPTTTITIQESHLCWEGVEDAIHQKANPGLTSTKRRTKGCHYSTHSGEKLAKQWPEPSKLKHTQRQSHTREHTEQRNLGSKPASGTMEKAWEEREGREAWDEGDEEKRDGHKKYELKVGREKQPPAPSHSQRPAAKEMGFSGFF